MSRIYLDHAATTPLLPEAKAAMAGALDGWANPSSPHREGRAARAALEEARRRIKAALGWEHELIFTSGASEAAAIALARGPGRPLAAAVEHAAVLASADAVRLPVGAAGDATAGIVAIEALAGVTPGALVAVQQVNNETGVIQPLDRIGAAVRAAGGRLFADCAQGAARLALPDADLIAVSAHKLGGPPGIGALLVRDLGALVPSGQGQEQGYRAGTENLPAILGFAAAVEAMVAQAPGWLAAAAGWRAALEARILAEDGEVVAAAAPRSPSIAAYRLPGMSAAAQLMRLDAAGFAVSAGSACSSGTMRGSHVLAALGLPAAAADEVIRVSFGWPTGAAEVEAFAAAWTDLARARRPRAA